MTDLAYDLSGKRVAVLGSRGMVGSALVRRLEREQCELITLARQDCDLRRQREVEEWIGRERPDLIFLSAAKVGGIAANSAAPAQFLYDNLMIETNVIEAARLACVEKLVFLGSSCIYPKLADQPISEDALLSGPLEPTNEWYAIAKIAGIKLCQAYRRQHACDFISAQPTNLYGPGDNYDLETSHVVPALLRKTHEAKLAGQGSLELWGTGSPKREFLHVDDLADALVFLAEHYSDEQPVNIGSGEEVSIAELARMVASIVDYRGAIEFDPSRPDGTPRKLLNSGRLAALGWTPAITLEAGLRSTYSSFARSTNSGGQLDNVAA